MRAGNPHFSFFFFALVAADVSCLHHPDRQALKLSTLWQPRYNSSFTASLCRPLLIVVYYACADIADMRVLTEHMRVCAVCAMDVCGLGVCGSVYLFVCCNQAHARFFFILFALLAAAAAASCRLYHNVLQAFKFSTLQPRYNSSRTASVTAGFLASWPRFTFLPPEFFRRTS